MSFTTPPAVEFIEGRTTARRPFIPLVGTIAAEIDQVPPQIFLSDPTRLSNGLQRAQRLFDLDAVCVVPDPSLLAEALGASVEWQDEPGRFVTTEYVGDTDSLTAANKITDEGRVPTIIEAANRLTESTDEDVAVFGVLPGAYTTAVGLFNDLGSVDGWRKAVRTATSEVAREFGRAGVDTLLVAESASVAHTTDGQSVAETTVELLDVIDNISDFFGTRLAFAPGECDNATVTKIVEQASIDALFLNVETPAAAPDVADVRIGCGITEAVLTEDDDEIERKLQERFSAVSSDVFLASGLEIPRGVHPRKLQSAKQAAETASQ